MLATVANFRKLIATWDSRCKRMITSIRLLADYCRLTLKTLMRKLSSRLTAYVGAFLVSSTWSNQIWPNNQSIRRALPAKCMFLIVSTMTNSTIGYKAPTSISTQPTAKDSPPAMEIKLRDRLPKTCCTRTDPVLSLALILISFQATRETTNMSSRLISTPEPPSP